MKAPTTLKTLSKIRVDFHTLIKRNRIERCSLLYYVSSHRVTESNIISIHVLHFKYGCKLRAREKKILEISSRRTYHIQYHPTDSINTEYNRNRDKPA